MTASAEQLQALVNAANAMSQAAHDFEDADAAKDESSAHVAAAMSIDDANQVVYD